jgi:tetratricopeptide (TPR) repeat protein
LACKWISSATLLVSTLTLGACRGTTPSESPSSSPAARLVTYNKDIAPVLVEHCASCHRPITTGKNAPNVSNNPNDPLCVAGAPFSLLDYATVRTHAREIAAATATRAMPPWLPESGPRFVSERRLRDDQIALIQNWVDHGTPEGDPKDRVPAPSWPDGWQLGTPDLVLTMPDAFTLPARGGDVFRNFSFPVPTSPARYVRAIEFRADNPRVLHHANVAVDPSRLARRLDRADSGPGFAAMPEGEIENVYGWSPGRVPVMEAADTAWILDEGSDLAVQLHMISSTVPETVRPSIGLYFSNTAPTRTPVVVKLESKTIDIPAGESAYIVEDSYVLPVDVEVVSVYPHAHYLATRMIGSATLPDGSKQTLVSIPQWDIRWQDQYRYQTPLSLPKGTTLRMHFTYDNSDRNTSNPVRPATRVRWGPKSTDEMGALWIEVIPRRAEDAARLDADHVERARRTDIAGAEAQVRASPNEAAAHNYLATKYLEAGRVPEATAELEHAVRLDPQDAEAHSNLGSVLQGQGKLSDASAHLRTAVRLKPGDDRVRFNFANLLQASGQIDDAISELRRAVRINPDNADAHFNLAMLLGPRNQLDEAIAHLTRVVDINPRSADAHRNLAVAYGLQGKLADAIRHDRASLRIQPNSPATQQHLDALLRAGGGPSAR